MRVTRHQARRRGWYIEYTHKIHEHILFGRYFDPCVSSGNRPLLTKNNECAGHESSVIWDAATARPLEGCYDAKSLDHDPFAEGVQSDFFATRLALVNPSATTTARVQVRFASAPDASGVIVTREQWLSVAPRRRAIRR